MFVVDHVSDGLAKPVIEPDSHSGGNMKRYLPSLLCVLLVGGWISTESRAQTGTPESHEAAAKAAAYTSGHDFTWIFDRNCGEFSRNVINAPARPPAAPTAARAPRTIPPRELWYEPPHKIFDNLYYIGSNEMTLADGSRARRASWTKFSLRGRKTIGFVVHWVSGSLATPVIEPDLTRGRNHEALLALRALDPACRRLDFD